MIIVCDRKSLERHEPPPWMAGADSLQEREDSNGRLWAIGDGMRVGPAPDRMWADVGDGYQAMLTGQFVPALIMRRPLWCAVQPLVDQKGRTWLAPVILTDNGATLAIQVTYGPGWVPDLTPAQASAAAAARWARQVIAAAVDGEGGLDTALACAAAADILSATHHITPDVLAALRLLDEGFMLGILRTAAGWVE